MDNENPQFFDNSQKLYFIDLNVIFFLFHIYSTYYTITSIRKSLLYFASILSRVYKCVLIYFQAFAVEKICIRKHFSLAQMII